MMLKSQKLEGRIRELETIEGENQELKKTREKLQSEMKNMYAERQKLNNDIISLQEELQAARKDSKQKLLQLQSLQKDYMGEKVVLQGQIHEHQEKIKNLNAEIQLLKSSYGKFNSKLESFERQYEHLQKKHEQDKQHHYRAGNQRQIKITSQAIIQAQAKQKNEAEYQAKAQNQINIAQAKILEAQIQALEKENHKQQIYKEEVKKAKKVEAEGMLQQQSMKMKMESEKVIGQLQGQHQTDQSSLLRYKQKVHELQKQLTQSDREILTRQAKLKEAHEIEIKLMKSDYDKQFIVLKKKIKDLQIELDAERNSISTKEEMIYSMADNMISEFQDFNQMNSSRSAKNKKKSKNYNLFQM